MRSPLIGVSTGFTDYGDYLGVAFGRPLEQIGATAVVLPYSAKPEQILPRLDGLLLAGGRDIEPTRFGGEPHPASTPHSALRDRFELALAPAAISTGIPVLGVCRGMQIINVALGGTLEVDHSLLAPPANRHPGGDWDRWEEVVRARLGGWPSPPHPSHEIAIVPGSRLAGVLGTSATVNSYHHQSIAGLGRGLDATARAPDGVIEAIEQRGAGSLVLGVQWEEQEQPGSPLFSLLVEAARQKLAARPVAPVAAAVSQAGVPGRRANG